MAKKATKAELIQEWTETDKGWVPILSSQYTQEDYDQVSQILLKGASLWERDHEQMENSHGFTRKEIEERIERFETNKEAGGKY